jgi:SAM-dependent methyltransferase
MGKSLMFGPRKVDFYHNYKPNVKKGNALNMGCGFHIFKSKNVKWTNLDAYPAKGVDKVHNMNKFPYPFKDNTFDFIICDNVMEHLDSIIKPIEELWRISKPNAVIEIITPYVQSRGAFGHIDHQQYFDESTYFWYDAKRFKKDKVDLRDVRTSLNKIRFKIDYRLITTGRFRRYLPFKYIFNSFFWNVYDLIHYRLEVIK